MRNGSDRLCGTALSEKHPETDCGCKKTSFRLAGPDEESKGIDGSIGEMPVSVKSVSCKSKPMLPEQIDVKIVYCEKKRGIKIFRDF